MRADKDARLKRVIELEAAGLSHAVIAERLGLSKRRVADVLLKAKKSAAG